MSAPLEGVRVVDLTTVLMGPHATQLLADWGADVIKVEPPGGDVIREIGPGRHRGMGALFLNCNRGKRSICLDLKHPEGKSALLTLLASADVFVSNIRPRAMQRLGLDPSSLESVHPRLIQVAMVGYGQDGPYAEKPAYDDLIQGASGMGALMASSGDGSPRYVPMALADRTVALAGVSAICAALFQRERSGKGIQIEVPMFETFVGLVASDHLAGLTFQPPLESGGYARLLAKERRPYKTLNGYVCAMIYTDPQWARFLARMELDDLPVQDPRFATVSSRAAAIDSVYGKLAEIFLSRTTEEWLLLLGEIDVPAMPMSGFEDLIHDPHLVATGFFREQDHPTEGPIRTIAPPVRFGNDSLAALPAPRCGEHGVAVLTEAGFTRKQIESLIAEGILLLPES